MILIQNQFTSSLCTLLIPGKISNLLTMKPCLVRLRQEENTTNANQATFRETTIDVLIVHAKNVHALYNINSSLFFFAYVNFP